MIRKVYNTIEEFNEQNKTLSRPLPFADDLSVLSKPLDILGHTVPNRLVCQAMEGCDGTPTGEPDELTRRRYLRFAKGGAGIIWFEATACQEDGRANPRQLWIREDNADSFKALLNEIREVSVREHGYAPIIIMQDTHSGRYSKPHGKPEPIIVRNNPIFEKDTPIDRIATDEEIDGIRDSLIHAATLAVKAGFDGVDIKCCHGYLNSELLSAFTRKNSRYGASFENRTRLLREAVKGAIDACPNDFIVSTRLNAYDGFPYPYGFGVKQDGSLDMDLTEPKKLVKMLADMGVKLVNITMGNPYVNPHVNRPFAKGGYEDEAHPLTGVLRMLDGIAEIQSAVPEVALISSALSYLGVAAPHVAAAYIERGDFTFAGFGRTIFAYPDFAKDILKDGKMYKNKICICCSKCTEIMRKPGGTPGCVIRDGEVYLPIYKELCGGNQ